MGTSGENSGSRGYKLGQNEEELSSSGEKLNGKKLSSSGEKLVFRGGKLG